MAGSLILLASASPRRSELLRQVGIAHEVRPVDVDETVRPDEAPSAYVLRLAEAKAAFLADFRQQGIELLAVVGLGAVHQDDLGALFVLGVECGAEILQALVQEVAGKDDRVVEPHRDDLYDIDMSLNYANGASSTGRGSAPDRILRDLGVRPAKVSKYCVAVAALHPELPSNPWHQTLQRYFQPLAPAA